MVEGHYSAREVVELLGITFNNLHQLQHRGTLKWTQKVGQKVYYPEETVNAYFEKRKARKKWRYDISVNMTEEVSIADIDEALGHIREQLQDRYGNRLNWKTKAILIESLDDLLDYRLMLTRGEDEHRNTSSGYAERIPG